MERGISDGEHGAEAGHQAAGVDDAVQDERRKVSEQDQLEDKAPEQGFLAGGDTGPRCCWRAPRPAFSAYRWKLDWLGERLLELVNALFALLAALGVVTDPTTEGLGDSERALAYTAPAARQ